MKNYKIKLHQKFSANDEVVREILTLEVTYPNGLTTEHGKEIPVGSDIKTEAVTFAAELDGVLKEIQEEVVEETELPEAKEVSTVDIEAKIAEIEAAKVVPVEADEINQDII